MLIFSTFYGHIGCPFGIKPKKCSSDKCSVCTDFPDAVCYPDQCSDCSPRYFMGNNDVTNICGKSYIFKCNVRTSIT